MEIERETCCMYLWYMSMLEEWCEMHLKLMSRNDSLLIIAFMLSLLVWVKIVLFWHFDGMIPTLISWNKPFQVKYCVVLASLFPSYLEKNGHCLHKITLTERAQSQNEQSFLHFTRMKDKRTSRISKTHWKRKGNTIICYEKPKWSFEKL